MNTNNINDFIEKFNTITQAYKSQSQAVFKELIKSFFTDNPIITAVTWDQYKMYWNDGEPCEFTVYDCYFTNTPLELLDTIDLRDDMYHDKETGYWVAFTYRLDEKPGVDQRACIDFQKILHSSDLNPILEAMFGDGVRITATIEGFTVTEVDHE
jgi:hypothetical protein